MLYITVHAVPIAAARQKGSLLSRHVNHVCLSGTAMSIAKGIIGRSTRRSVNNELPRDAMRRCSSTHRPRKTVLCFLPMPVNLIACMTLPPGTISSVPIQDFAKANERLAKLSMEQYYECCGKRICRGCIESLFLSDNDEYCPYCKAERKGKTEDERVNELMKRVDVNDTGAMYVLGTYYFHGQLGLHQDQEKAMTLYARAADLGYSKAHLCIGVGYDYGHEGDLKKAKFHYEAAAMAGHEVVQFNLGNFEAQSGNMERAMKYWTISASAGHYNA